MAINFISSESIPINNEDQFPVGQEIILVFDNPVDIKTFKECCILFGSDFDRTSGPDNSLWLNQSSGRNDFFLRSPHFKGFVDYDVKQYYVDDKALERIDGLILTTKPTTTNQKTTVVITPKNVLKEDSSYQLFIVGNDIENVENIPTALQNFTKDKAISFKTIYHPYYIDGDGGLEIEERVSSYGSFEPKNNEITATLHMQIINAGEGSQAQYKWWFADETEPQVGNPNYNNRVGRCVQRWRVLDRGVYVRFSGAQYNLNEEILINCYEREYLEDSYLISFDTSNREIYTIPDDVSTSPLLEDDQLGNISSSDDILKVVSMKPIDGSVNEPLDLKQIEITFNKNLDASTVTQDTVSLKSLPASGFFDGNAGTRSDRERKIFKIISVVDNKIILEL
tara:strand:+ start:822 stop:2009 length:1188 start_codon:yes stop_codon:yes gene_type:complete